MLSNATITVFNAYTDAEDKLYYYASIIKDVHAIADKGAAQTKTGLEDADSFWCSIPYAVNGDDIYVNGKRYLGPIAWEKQINDDLPNTLTFCEGKDLILKGVWTGDSIIKSADYSRQGFYDYLLRNYDDVYIVSSVGKYDLIPHFEVRGK